MTNFEEEIFISKWDHIQDQPIVKPNVTHLWYMYTSSGGYLVCHHGRLLYKRFMIELYLIIYVQTGNKMNLRLHISNDSGHNY